MLVDFGCGRGSGHGCGDDVLRRLGELLNSRTRTSDLAARLGGDEFALWMDDIDAEGAREKALQLLSFKEDLRAYSGDTNPPLSLSVGICMTDPHRRQNLSQLLEAADNALYDVKKRGKGALTIIDTASATDRSNHHVE